MTRPVLFVRTVYRWMLPLQVVLLAFAITGALAWILTGNFGGVPWVGALALGLFVLVSVGAQR